MFKDYLQLHFIVLLWGFTAILGLLISIPALELVFYRTLLAIAGLGAILLIRKQSVKLDGAAIIRLIFTGTIVGMHWVLFFASARVANASICLAGMATCSLWTSVLEPFVNKKAVKWYEVVSGLVIMAGLYVIFRFEFNQMLGLTLALASAFLASVFTVINSRFTKKYHHQTITFYEMIGAWLVSLISLPIYQHLLNNGEPLQLIPQATDWVWIMVLAWACTVYAYAASVELMKRLTAFAVNLTVNLEPVYGILLAAVFFNEHEQLTGGFYMGAAIILVAVLTYPLLKRWDDARSRLSGV